MFRDRIDAGRQLAVRLDERGVEADIVVAIPRGGLPIGRVVADSLGVPLDIVAARKLGAPGNAELAIGAVASDGAVWLNESLIDELGIGNTYVDDRIRRERAAAQRKVETYRSDRPPLDLTGKRVVIVDDGIATGATAIACIRQLRNAGAEHIVVAVPVAPPGTAERLIAEADEMVCVETPAYFEAVGGFYDDFEQVSDRRAKSFLVAEQE